MNQDFILPDPWSIIEEGYDPTRVQAADSLFSIGNGAMGQRANFEEHYTGKTFQGSYIGGVYYPDKTKVGWWKNGYPEYFAKVLNAPSWIGINLYADDIQIDLNRCEKVDQFRRELNMKEGWYKRSFLIELENGLILDIQSIRFLSMAEDELGAISYSVTPVNRKARIRFCPYLEGGVVNQDSNWEERFWKVKDVKQQGDNGMIIAETLKTQFKVCAFMSNQIYLQGDRAEVKREFYRTPSYIEFRYDINVRRGDTATLYKYGGYTTSLNHDSKKLHVAATKLMVKASEMGFAALLEQQKLAWSKIWELSDISIDGDVKAQQGIRFNIFQLNQTYTGKDARLNIGPKGFTGEKYGGSTYWDTEAYCLPFYMATKDPQVARNLLEYRYKHLQKAKENAQKLGFQNGAALYPMVTMNGEECHNEWEITFEEIHRNGAIFFAIYNYLRYTNDIGYVLEMGLEVMIAIARFWSQRASYSKAKESYVILGVTGPNEYENNVNNNFYTNYIARWCLRYTEEMLKKVASEYEDDFRRVTFKEKLFDQERTNWKEVADKMYLPYSEEHQIFLQQDGFLDKDLVPAAEIDRSQRPINQHWSWDRILRSPYIKQADTLQTFYFFEDHFSKEELQRHFDFYEPFTVHESSLSPCVHSILASSLNRIDKAYELYLRTSRLDLDDYNKEVHEGCHITSMAGTWMSVVEGFGGLRIRQDCLYLEPRIPKQWSSYSFKMIFRKHIVSVSVAKNSVSIHNQSAETLRVRIYDKELHVPSNNTSTMNL